MSQNNGFFNKINNSYLLKRFIFFPFICISTFIITLFKSKLNKVIFNVFNAHAFFYKFKQICQYNIGFLLLSDRSLKVISGTKKIIFFSYFMYHLIWRILRCVPFCKFGLFNDNFPFIITMLGYIAYSKQKSKSIHWPIKNVKAKSILTVYSSD